MSLVPLGALGFHKHLKVPELLCRYKDLGCIRIKTLVSEGVLKKKQPLVQNVQRPTFLIGIEKIGIMNLDRSSPGQTSSLFSGNIMECGKNSEVFNLRLIFHAVKYADVVSEVPDRVTPVPPGGTSRNSRKAFF